MDHLKQRLLEITAHDLLETHHLLATLLRDGLDRQELVDCLHQLDSELDAAQNEQQQDRVKDALDLFYGWCAPSLRL